MTKQARVDYLAKGSDVQARSECVFGRFSEDAKELMQISTSSGQSLGYSLDSMPTRMLSTVASRFSDVPPFRRWSGMV